MDYRRKGGFGGCNLVSTALAGAMKSRSRAWIFCSSFLLFMAAIPSFAGEHPGILHADENCSSCHRDKVIGKSVHAAMALACGVCHRAETQGDMTMLDLAMPKEQICFACHARSAKLERHSPGLKGPCIDCHDAHSSKRQSLLRAGVEARRSGMETPPLRASRKGTDQP